MSRPKLPVAILFFCVVVALLPMVAIPLVVDRLAANVEYG